VTSADFTEGSTVPDRFTCTGEDRSPSLTISTAPRATAAFVLIVDDPDAPGGTFLHWTAYDLPPATSSIPEDVPRAPDLISGGHQGMNGFGKVGYNGPCPPVGAPHRYRFQVYALDAATNLPGGAELASIRAAMSGHVIASSILTANYGR
jgi:hypothetical protein